MEGKTNGVLLAMVLLGMVVLVSGWDQVRRSIHTLIVHSITVNETINDVPAATLVSGAAAGATALQGISFAQVDTNATTVTTNYVPAFLGQVLLGGAGDGTNGLWVATGLEMDDWAKVTIAE